MASGFPFFMAPQAEELGHLRRNWGWLVGLGLLLILGGMMALSCPYLATEAFVTVMGVLFLFSAGVEVASGIWGRRWGGFFLHLLVGLLYFFLGLIFLERTGQAAEVFTLVLAIAFFVGGLFRIIVALTQRFSGWGWMLFSGIITLLLGILIWRQMPEAAYWVIGTFVGIDLIFTGMSWLMLGLAVRQVPQQSATGP